MAESDTPETDALEQFHCDTVERDWDALKKAWAVCRRLERERNTAETIAHRAEHRANQAESERDQARRLLAQCRPSAEAVHFAKMALGMITEERGSTWSEATVIPMARELLRVAKIAEGE